MQRLCRLAVSKRNISIAGPIVVDQQRFVTFEQRLNRLDGRPLTLR
jgi:hypothetical protein